MASKNGLSNKNDKNKYNQEQYFKEIEKNLTIQMAL